MVTSTEAAELDEAWVLHARPFRNTSLILEVLSERRGRCGVVARGGRRNALLQPFRPLMLSLGGRGELASLRHVEAAAPAAGLRGRALYCGFYMNEILLRLLHREDPHPELLAPYRETLDALATGHSPQDVCLRRFEMALLNALGYGFALDHDSDGRPVDPGRRYRLETEQGLVVAMEEGFAGTDLLALAAGEWTTSVRAVARQLMREALAPYLGERPLQSRALFRER